MGLPPIEGVLRPEGLAGHLAVGIEAPDAVATTLVLRSRAIHRATRELRRFELDPDEPLAGITAELAALAPSIPELEPEGTSFRVSSARTGSHPFTSEDVARCAGAGIRQTVLRPVRMRGFDVEVRCDVRDRSCIVGVRLTGSSLSRRSAGPYTQRTSLRANLAWGLLRLTGLEAAPARLLDPFCGSGTVLEEAGALWPGTRLCGGDLFEGPAEGARANLAHAGLGDRAEIRRGDARQLEQTWPEGGFDAIVTNPPFGKRLGRSIDLRSFYADFLNSADRVATPAARMVVLVQRRAAFNQALARVAGWRTRHVRIVELGGLYAGAFLLSRPS